MTLVGQGNRRHSFVAMDDVAAYPVPAVHNPAARSRQIFIGGPEAHSWNEVVERMGGLLGREVPVRHVAPGEPIPGLPETPAQLAAGMDSYDSPLDMGETVRTFGVQATPAGSLPRRDAGDGERVAVTSKTAATPAREKLLPM